MDPNTLAFVGVAIAVSVVPGPDMALVTRNTLLGGRRMGAATVVGIVGGIFGWSLMAVAGIAAILAASVVVFTAVKIGGAVYLVYLGIATVRAHPGDHAGLAGAAPPSLRAAAGQGLLSAGLNPKLGVFFLTLLPQFTGPTGSASRSLELAVLFAAIGVSWLLVYTYLIGSAGRFLSRPRPRRVLRWATGTVLIGLGARVALERA